MSKVITFSTKFPGHHPRKGNPTLFIEKIWQSTHDVDFDFKAPLKAIGLVDTMKAVAPKYHTIRSGNRFKKGDKFSPRIWSGAPYNSKQIIIGPDIEIKKTWSIEIMWHPVGTKLIKVNDKIVSIKTIDKIISNDGLVEEDFWNWFIKRKSKPIHFTGQIICWNENINY